jgi:hypothetical protein
MTGNGFCGERSFILQVHLWDAAENLLQTIVSDVSWLTSSGAIVSDSTYYGVCFPNPKFGLPAHPPFPPILGVV